MEFFTEVIAVRLQSNHKKYLVAAEDGRRVRQHPDGSSDGARWAVELVHSDSDGEDEARIRLRSCRGRYLSVPFSSHPRLDLFTDKVVVQLVTGDPDVDCVEWQPLPVGSRFFFRCCFGDFLFADAGWRNTVMVSNSKRVTSDSSDWFLWDVEVLEGHVRRPLPPPPFKFRGKSRACDGASSSAATNAVGDSAPSPRPSPRCRKIRHQSRTSDVAASSFATIPAAVFPVAADDSAPSPSPPPRRFKIPDDSSSLDVPKPPPRRSMTRLQAPTSDGASPSNDGASFPWVVVPSSVTTVSAASSSSTVAIGSSSTDTIGASKAMDEFFSAYDPSGLLTGRHASSSTVATGFSATNTTAAFSKADDESFSRYVPSWLLTGGNASSSSSTVAIGSSATDTTAVFSKATDESFSCYLPSWLLNGGHASSSAVVRSSVANDTAASSSSTAVVPSSSANDAAASSSTVAILFSATNAAPVFSKAADKSFSSHPPSWILTSSQASSSSTVVPSIAANDAATSQILTGGDASSSSAIIPSSTIDAAATSSSSSKVDFPSSASLHRLDLEDFVRRASLKTISFMSTHLLSTECAGRGQERDFPLSLQSACGRLRFIYVRHLLGRSICRSLRPVTTAGPSPLSVSRSEIKNHR
ncbi:hypothetical protein MUK42_30313 [Musa troglodytarum]|uniref:DUF569 domain-containing protein n=1 Tax=Musa troglodytarum TaxID=320322 RepID=A0A9E7FH73_9LILI|nr:hypothetical protein MUK42_30313 [Musa troglodytarum]